MPFTSKDIEKRLEALDRDRQAHEAQINAIMGAIQELESWLAQMKAEEQPPAATPLALVSERCGE